MVNGNIDPQQKQNLPGEEKFMRPLAQHDNPNYRGSGKLKDKVAIITGADSGIGKSVAIAFAKEGAKLILSYLSEHEDAQDTKIQVEKYGGECVLISGDLRDKNHCERIVSVTIDKFSKLDILINHAGEQYQTDSLEDVKDDKLQHLFETNVFSMIYLARAALQRMQEGSCMVNTVSVVAYKGNPKLLDYSASKGANLAFTRALAASVAEKGIRVNGVAPGPIWTPLIPASFTPDKLESFGKDTPLKRPGQPYELVAAYVYLASNIDSSYVTGQVIHVNGGIPVNS